MRNKDGTPAMLLLAYVDDLIIAAKSTKDINHVFEQLATKWRITSLGEAKHVLGLKVERDRTRKVIHLSQPPYIDKLSERFPGYSLRVAKAAPLPVTRDRGDQDEDEDISIKTYQELVGSLMWAASCTRPDTAFAASFLARRTAEPKQSDMDLALRVVSYLVQTRTHGKLRTSPLRPTSIPTGPAAKTHAARPLAMSHSSLVHPSTGLPSANRLSLPPPWKPNTSPQPRPPRT
jgi:hypothetical protein